ncbi:MAG: TolC family protein [Pedobacter sp.]|jgi:outer membrane protein TolC|nr:MAG: TolC family protein [Pedobacter sp.]
MKSATGQILLLATHLLGLSVATYAQTTTNNNTDNSYLTLKQCIDYALLHQPALNQALINEDITKANNAISLAGWWPQVNASGSLIHYNQLGLVPTNQTTGSTAGGATSSQARFINTFIPQLSASQVLFNPSLLYAIKGAPLYIKQAQQSTSNTKIDLVSNLSKSFYSILLTIKQIEILKEDTTRLGKTFRDAYYRYKSGIADETDYEQAMITLNNSRTQLRQANENITPLYAGLKQLMGYPDDKQFKVSFDTLQMIKAIDIDTLQQLAYEKRIEYQQLQTQRHLQHEQTRYYQFAFIPTASAFYNYNLGFQNNQFSNLFSDYTPSSYLGISLNIPIFTGLARIRNLNKSRLQEKLIDWGQTDLKSQINKEYTTALAGYKSNRYNFELSEKNVATARRAYFVVDLQYKQGIVAYLNVITAESNLITSEINYLNALFQTLSSKIDLEKAMGILPSN